MEVKRFCGLRGADCGIRANVMPNQRPDSLDALVREITARGNDVEVRTCREGIKVLEITKRVAGVFPKNGE